jgi:hypothetical protein
MFIAPEAAEHRLAGKDFLVSLAEAARTIGLEPSYLEQKDWRRLASQLAGLGFRQRSIDGVVFAQGQRPIFRKGLTRRYHLAG